MRGCGEIKLISERLLEAGGFAEEQFAPLRVLFVLQPGKGELGACQPLRQRQFARDGGEHAFTVELDQVARIGFAETVLDTVENLMTNDAGDREREQAGQQQSQQRLATQSECGHAGFPFAPE